MIIVRLSIACTRSRTHVPRWRASLKIGGGATKKDQQYALLFLFSQRSRRLSTMSTTTSVDLEKRSLNVDAPLGSPIEEKQAESSGSLASLKGVPAVHGQLQPNEEQLNRALTSRQVSMIAIA